MAEHPTCQRGGCSQAAIETCTVISLGGNECVKTTCADHRCPCADGIKRPLPSTEATP